MLDVLKRFFLFCKINRNVPRGWKENHEQVMRDTLIYGLKTKPKCDFDIAEDVCERNPFVYKKIQSTDETFMFAKALKSGKCILCIMHFHSHDSKVKNFWQRDQWEKVGARVVEVYSPSEVEKAMEGMK